MSNLNQKQPVTSGGVVFACVFFFIIFLVFKCTCSQTDEEKAISNEENLKTKALVYSQNCVEQQLKSPSSAEFPFGEGTVTKVDNDTFIVTSYVDSQNSFGAMIRTNYSCQVTLTGEDSYTCDNVELFE